MAKRCYKCGRIYPNDHNFCQACGISLVWYNLELLKVPIEKKIGLPEASDETKKVTIIHTTERPRKMGPRTRRDHYKQGDSFEAYVARELFPTLYYDVLHVTPRRSDLGGRYIESAKDPDLHIRDNLTNHRFWVECKFRTDASMKDRKLVICKNKAQFDRYKRFQEEHRPERVYIVVGMNGKVDAPRDLYCIPLDDLECPSLFLDKLEPFRRSPGRAFEYRDGRLV